MEIVIILILIFIGCLFGWFCGDVCFELKRHNSRKEWVGWLVLVLGLIYMWVGAWQSDYHWKHKEYNSAKYEIVRDTVITNHNGQIDTTATFKIVKLPKENK